MIPQNLVLYTAFCILYIYYGFTTLGEATGYLRQIRDVLSNQVRSNDNVYVYYLLACVFILDFIIPHYIVLYTSEWTLLATGGTELERVHRAELSLLHGALVLVVKDLLW
jgi:hypothetical protein